MFKTPSFSFKTALLFAVAAACSLQATVLQAQPQDERREPVVQVAGEGQASIAPDTALVSLAVVRNATTADAALSDNNAAMREVLAFLRENGIGDRDTQTSGFSIHPQYRQQEPKDGGASPPEVVGYEVSNMLTVKVRDLARLGSLLDGSVKLGVNQGGQISFTNDKPEAVFTDARKAAVADAMDKAKTLAAAAGVKLGRILEISEGAPVAAPAPVMRMTMAKEMGDAVPVAAGENTYSVSVTMSFALEQ